MFKIKRYNKNFQKKFDPAPSRVSYLLQRFWLRKYLRVSLIFVIVMTLLSTIWTTSFKKLKLQATVTYNFEKFIDTLIFSPALKIVNLNIITDDQSAVDKIKAALKLTFPLSSLDVNVEELKLKVEAIDLVRSASVRLTSEAVIEIIVKVRKPIVVHRVGEHFLLIDIEGVKVDQVFSRNQRLDLPLLVGEGAEHFVAQALQLLIESKNLLTRVRGLVRVGQRRWDVVLDHNQLINLPERNPIRAMKKIVLLHEGRKLLDRDISYIDFRNIDRPILGLTETSSEELKELRRLARGESV